MHSATKAFADHTMKLAKEVQDDYDKIRLMEPLITEDLLQVANDQGNTLDGLVYSVKTASSVDDKISRMTASKPHVTSEKALKNLPDIVRYTQICKHDDIIKTAQDTKQKLEEKGYKLSVVRNYYLNPYPGTGYQGLHMNFISPQGVTFELQVHSEESFAVKQKGHEMYEVFRAVSTPIEKKEEIKPKIQELHGSVAKPSGYEQMPTFMLSPDEIRQFMASIPPIEHDMKREDGCLQYRITQDGKELISGCEIESTDHSMTVFRTMENKDDMECFCITPEGVCSKEFHLPDKDLMTNTTIDQFKTVGAVMENVHQTWENVQKAGTDEKTKQTLEMADTPVKILRAVKEQRQWVHDLTEQKDTKPDEKLQELKAMMKRLTENVLPQAKMQLETSRKEIEKQGKEEKNEQRER